MSNIYPFSASDITGKPVSLASYQGKVLLIVNVASQCTFTKQYAELEQLYREFHPQGLEILAFPCNQFGEQEPGSEAEIQAFCDTNYHISFPLFSKVEVNGTNAHPLFNYLKEQAPGIFGSKKIKWNFTKFLVNASGQAVKRYAPMTKPQQIRDELMKLINCTDHQ